MKLLVAIPTFNEADTIGASISRVRTIIPSARIIVCDGGSKDYTRDIAEFLGCEVLDAPSYGDAIQTAFKNVRLGEAYVIIMDSESHEISDMYPFSKFAEGTLVAGYRTDYSASRLRKLITKIARFYVHALFTTKIKDVTSGFRAYPYALAKELALKDKLFKAPNYVVNVGLALESSRLGWPTCQFAMQYIGGHSNLTFWKFVRAILWGIHLIVEHKFHG